MTDIQPSSIPALVTLPNVDILATGEWALSSGPATFTAADLANAVQAAQCPAVGSPVLKLGHVDPRFDGEPAFGRVANMALTASGNKITGDLAGMPAWLGTILASAYPNRSIEGYYDFPCQLGHVHPFAIKALALLGVTPPGVGVLSSLADVAALYGIAASDGGTGRPWKTLGVAMPPIAAAGVTTEDVRRAYYDASSTPMSYWITELQLAPTPQLIVCDEATANIYRVPITIKGTDVSFGDPVQVQVEYQDLPAGGATAAAARARWGSPVAARAGLVAAAWDGPEMVKNLGSDPTATQIKALFALPADTKSDSKLPHHDVSDDGVVGAADTGGVEAALAALNGSQGGLKDLSDEDKQKAYDHLSAHYKAAGKTPPPLMAAAAHGPFVGEHSHPHSAMGSQGGDEEHDHSHTHNGDAVHDHHNAATASGNVTGNGPQPGKEGARMQIEVTEEDLAQVRTLLGKPADAELTGAEILAGLKDRDDKVAQASAKVSAASDADKGMVRVDAAQWDALQVAAKAGEEARAQQLTDHRDSVINAAVRAGKFPVSRKEHWQKLWAKDPEGTEESIGTLAAGLVPLVDIGDAGGEPGTSEDAMYAELFGPVDSPRA